MDVEKKEEETGSEMSLEDEIVNRLTNTAFSEESSVEE